VITHPPSDLEMLTCSPTPPSPGPVPLSLSPRENLYSLRWPTFSFLFRGPHSPPVRVPPPPPMSDLFFFFFSPSSQAMSWFYQKISPRDPPSLYLQSYRLRPPPFFLLLVRLVPSFDKTSSVHILIPKTTLPSCLDCFLFFSKFDPRHSPSFPSSFPARRPYASLFFIPPRI